jgi:hypothetical protein
MGLYPASRGPKTLKAFMPINPICSDTKGQVLNRASASGRHYTNLAERGRLTRRTSHFNALGWLRDLLFAPAACEQFAVNANTWRSSPLSPSNTYVHVIPTSNGEASAKNWSAPVMEGIKMVPFDRMQEKE